MNPLSINPWVIIVAGGLVVAGLFSVGMWQRGEGRQLERTDWMDRENKELVSANAEIVRLNFEAVEKAKVHLKNLADIDTKHQKEVVANGKQRDRDIADAHSGALGLRFRAACQGAGTGIRGEAGTSPSGGDGAATIELPRKIVASLSELANDADAVADQLRAAQAVIVEDRRLCGSK